LLHILFFHKHMGLYKLFMAYEQIEFMVTNVTKIQKWLNIRDTKIYYESDLKRIIILRKWFENNHHTKTIFFDFCF